MMSAPPSPHPTFFVSWKLNAPQAPKVPSGLPVERRTERLRRVLDHRDVAAELGKRVHVAGVAGVVDGDHGRVRGVSSGDLARVEVAVRGPRRRRPGGRPGGRTRWRSRRT